MERPSKKPRLADEEAKGAGADADGRPILPSLTRSISPVEQTRQITKTPDVTSTEPLGPRKTINSPFTLTRIRDLPPWANVHVVSLRDILGDPLISECWEFNYLHDVDFLMSAFDQDVKDLVKVHIVHGFWKQEDPSRKDLHRQASRYKNFALHAAFLPEMFGTHHSKMLILLRHDDSAQVVIHTANMIPRDWRNMTQAVWRSPLLPLLREGRPGEIEQDAIGTGARFKSDLLSYLRAYDTRRVTCRPVIEALAKYDFSAVKASLVASVPGRHNVRDDYSPRWGWAAMKQALREVPVEGNKNEVVIQVSSIATLGPTDYWLRNTLFNALSSHKGAAGDKPNFKIVFPTPDEIRRSLDGYASGASIHTKIQSPQQVKQLQYLRPMFYHWANDSPNGTRSSDDKTPSEAPLEAGRKRAAPHIKTYIRYGENSIDWALLTSANLSKQAWGDAASTSGEMRLSSYEIGVLVWPSLFDRGARMIPTSLTDVPAIKEGDDGASTTVGLRVPYNLPLQRYKGDEVPWVATTSHSEPDRLGRTWGK